MKDRGRTPDSGAGEEVGRKGGRTQRGREDGQGKTEERERG